MIGELTRSLTTEPGQRSLPLVQTVVPPSSVGAKVALFRSLFRGREDVFPKLWINRKTGVKGYSPVCANEWRPGVCEKPRVRCGDCRQQAFVPVEDRPVIAHLRGHHVMGVYPLLADETCWLLAADFDKHSWTDDVAAFRETCDGIGVSVAIERSRSGNGAHAWFFFTAPVDAAAARKMGCFLLTETMARRHSLALASYDRLFPNQDTMPRGGFGNLIALPLQHAARTAGNTEFVDERLTPYADQWAFLAAVQRIAPARVAELAAEAVRSKRVVGADFDQANDESDSTPWTRPPSGRTPRPLAPLPATIVAVLAQRLYVATDGLPSAFVHRIKRLATFHNPEFCKRQAMRRPIAGTPRVIGCFEHHPQHLSLPRGCRDALDELAREHGAVLAVEDRRTEGALLDVRFHGQLSLVQQEAVNALAVHETGIFVAPPGSGKTVVGAQLIAARARSALVLVHRKPLMDQWVAQLARFLGLDPAEVGTLGGGRHRLNGRLDVAMIQSLVRGTEVDDRIAPYGHVLVDECHHVPAFAFERVVSATPARYVLGLSATPYRRDGHQPILFMQCGPVRHAIDPRSAAASRPFAQRLLARETGFRLDGAEVSTSIQEVYAALVDDPARNALIVEDVICALVEGRSPVVITERREHLELLAARLQGFAPHTIVLHGGLGAKARREAMTRLAAVLPREQRLVLATGGFLGEGFDDARLDTLFLAMPVAWKGTLVQYVGRLHRLHAGKFEVRVYDYVDREVPVLERMFQKRLRGYEAIGYRCDDGAFAFSLDSEGPDAEAPDAEASS